MNYMNKVNPPSQMVMDMHKRSSPPESKVSYHSHYLDHDESPESLVLEDIKGSGLRRPNNINTFVDDQPPLAQTENMKTFKKTANYLTDQQKSQSSRLQNYTTAYFKNQNKDRNLKIDVDLSHAAAPETSLNESCKTQGNHPSSSKAFGKIPSMREANKALGGYKRGKEVETK